MHTTKAPPLQRSVHSYRFGPRKHSGVAFSAHCFGGPFNWTLRHLQSQSDVAGNQVLVERLWEIMLELGARKVFAPSPVTFNARVVSPKLLTSEIVLGAGFTLYRNALCPADGTWLSPGQAGIISAAGCPVIVACYENRCVFAHAGRDSLLDRGRISGTNTREVESVCESMLEALAAPKALRGRAYFYAFFSIGPSVLTHELAHPAYGEFNRAMHFHLRRLWGEGCSYEREGIIHLNLMNLIRNQLMRFGVPKRNITLHAKKIEKRPELFHTRDGGGQNRNLIVIARHA